MVSYYVYKSLINTSLTFDNKNLALVKKYNGRNLRVNIKLTLLSFLYELNNMTNRPFQNRSFKSKQVFRTETKRQTINNISRQYCHAYFRGNVPARLGWTNLSQKTNLIRVFVDEWETGGLTNDAESSHYVCDIIICTSNEYRDPSL